MPLYEYECAKCHKKIEKIQKVGDQSPQKCPCCGGALNKLLSIPAIKFKGSGWYVTDYAGSRGNLNPAQTSACGKKKESAGTERLSSNKTEQIKT